MVLDEFGEAKSEKPETEDADDWSPERDTSESEIKDAGRRCGYKASISALASRREIANIPDSAE